MEGHISRSDSPEKGHKSKIEILTRPDGVRFVELRTKYDKIGIILRNGEPYITMSTGLKDFNKLSEEDRELVRNTLLGH